MGGDACAKMLSVFSVCVLLTFQQVGSFQNLSKNKGGDQCFCKLKGQLDDCSCRAETVDGFNNAKVYPRIRSLLMKDYFRFYKVNLKRPCPFWADDSRCAIRHCHVEKCPEEDIPVGLKFDMDDRFSDPAAKYSKDGQECDEDYDKELGYLNKTISPSSREHFALWKEHDDALDNFCDRHYGEDPSGQAEYVDLLLNPERYTGYRGYSAHRIWRSIYLENCFRPKNNYGSYIKSSKLEGLCLEKRAFYRAVSGLHSSINIHLCSLYLFPGVQKPGLEPSTGTWGPNLAEFQQRFSPETTGGEGPHWLRNLYFVYLLELRALAKAAPLLLHEDYFTGVEDEDKAVKEAVSDILGVISSFPEHFNESSMFMSSSNTSVAWDQNQANKLKAEFREHFRNISRIMDCVGCDKCKLWGKLQIHGLGTALKILFSSRIEDRVLNRESGRSPEDFQLERSEIVALFNAFGRLSTSIFKLEEFRKMMR
ncbi:ero1-like protein [Ischnura elegans]|uniref:ero1-like protein n=1 Tax=Ischnura elegans TaxID=197161 RepID=UPI001ED8A8E6|nr:ero1-like protein [Ischnura elegans]